MLEDVKGTLGKQQPHERPECNITLRLPEWWTTTDSDDAIEGRDGSTE